MDNIREIPWTAAMDRQQKWLDIAGRRIPAGRCIVETCGNQAQGWGLTCGDHECMIFVARELTQESRSYLVEMRATMPELDEGEPHTHYFAPWWLAQLPLWAGLVVLAWVLVTR